MSLLEKEPKKPYLTTRISDKNFQSVISQDSIGRELQEKLSEANILLVPNQGYVDQPDLLYFPAGTSDLYQYIQERGVENIKADVCLEEKDYKELALHSDWLRIAEFIVKELVVQLFITLIADYIVRQLGARLDKTNVSSKLIVVNERNRQQIEFIYEGPAKEYRSVMLNAVSKISSKSLPIPNNMKSKRKSRTKKKRK
jgi:hypothetical protein